MRTERNQLLAVLSEALDCVEKELIGVTDHHAKRVAMCCIRMAEHTHTLDRFNNAKRAEVRDRVKHSVVTEVKLQAKED